MAAGVKKESCTMCTVGEQRVPTIFMWLLFLDENSEARKVYTRFSVRMFVPKCQEH